MSILIVCLLLHGLAAYLIPSPWWVPNLTLVGWLLALGRGPRHWLLFAVVVGLVAMSWAVRSAAAVGVSCLVCGWVAQRLARRWDMTDWRVHSLAVLIASAAMTAGLLWRDALWSSAILGLAGAHVALTTLSGFVLHNIAPGCHGFWSWRNHGC